MVEPTEKSLKDFKKKIKDATGKTLTLSQEVWMNRVNPIIRGKVNYYLYPVKAIEKNKLYGVESHCFYKSIYQKLGAVDVYTRRRLRVCMIQKHPSVRKGLQMGHKWTVEYFCRAKLIPGDGFTETKTMDRKWMIISKVVPRNGKRNRRIISRD